MARLTGILHEESYSFTVLLSALLRMWNVPDKV